MEISASMNRYSSSSLSKREARPAHNYKLNLSAPPARHLPQNNK
jgi:hypothetical protein